MMKLFPVMIVGIVLMFSSVLSPEAAESVESIEILSISHTKESTDVENISFALETQMEPRSFRINGNNPRLVLDFVNCIYKGQNSIILKDSELSTAIRTGIHHKPIAKTRVVIDLSRDIPVTYSQYFEADSKTLIVKIERQSMGSDNNSEVVDQQTSKSKPSQTELDAIPLDKKPIPPVFSQNEKTDSAVSASQSSVQIDEEQQKSESIPPKAEQKKNDTDIVAVKTKEVSEKANSQQKQKGVGVAQKRSEPGYGKQESKAAVGTPSPGPELLGLSFDDSSNRGEMVLFHLNDFFPPTVSAIEKETPRVLCDFNDMRLGKDVTTSLFANGKYVERIRAARHENPGKVRVVLDLAPDRDYDLQQVFFKNDNLFVLIVNELPAENEKN